MALRLALVDDSDKRFDMPAPSLPAEYVSDEVWMMLGFYNDCFQAYLKKAPQYGQAWMEQGSVGNLSRIKSKVARLSNMLWKKSEEAAKMVPPVDLDDSLIDLPNLCAFLRANQMMGNTHG